MTRISKIALVLSGLAILAVPVVAEEIVTFRKGAAIEKEVAAPPVPRVENRDEKRIRNYAEQPPTIPHTVRGYEVTKNANKCLACHDRTRIAETQAPMVSVTHFMDRDNQVLATVSPRRYFCNQCHVTQDDVKPLIDNTFVDVEDILKSGKAAQ